MDPVTLVLVASVVGGSAIAWGIGRLQKRRSDALPVPTELTISTDVINISRIRAAGLGGLGLCAMALVVAVFVPSIRLAVAAGILSGVALAVVLILRRRRTDPLPSSGGSAGANVILSIDQPATQTGEKGDSPPTRLQTAGARAL